MQSPERVEAKSEQSRRLLERAKRRRRIVPPSTSCGLNQAALGTRVKNPGVAESSSWFRSTHLLRSIPLRCRLVTRSRLARLSDPEPGRKRRASAWSYVIFPFGSQPATVSRSLLLFRRVCALYPLHSRAQLFSRGENRLQSTDYFESRSRPDDQNFLSPPSSLRLRNPCETTTTTATSKVTRTSLPPRFEVWRNSLDPRRKKGKKRDARNTTPWESESQFSHRISYNNSPLTFKFLNGTIFVIVIN